jgi:hypothetical protein
MSPNRLIHSQRRGAGVGRGGGAQVGRPRRRDAFAARSRAGPRRGDEVVQREEREGEVQREERERGETERREREVQREERERSRERRRSGGDTDGSLSRDIDDRCRLLMCAWIKSRVESCLLCTDTTLQNASAMLQRCIANHYIMERTQKQCTTAPKTCVLHST